MIPQDLIKRVTTAHDSAVRAAQIWEACTPGTRTKEVAAVRRENAEKRFEAALAALIDAA